MFRDRLKQVHGDVDDWWSNLHTYEMFSKLRGWFCLLSFKFNLYKDFGYAWLKELVAKRSRQGCMTQMHSFSEDSSANFEVLNQCYYDVYFWLVFYQGAIYIYARYNNTASPENKNNNSRSHNNKKEYFYLINC